MQNEISLPAWMNDALKQNIETEIFSVSVRHRLVVMSSSYPFLEFLTSYFSIESPVNEILKKKPSQSLKFIVNLLLLHPGCCEDKLISICFDLVSYHNVLLETEMNYEGRQVMGRSVTTVDPYTWLLTNICGCIATFDSEQFIRIEKILMAAMLSPSSSIVVRLLVSDIWCFVARYGSSNLCYSYVNLLSSILHQLNSASFSLTVWFIQLLLERLEQFLSPTDLENWKKKNEKDLNINHLKTYNCTEILECLKNRHTSGDVTFVQVVSESWGKLVEGSYEASNKLVSVKLLTALTKATSMNINLIPSDDLSTLIYDLCDLAKLTGRKPFVLFCAWKLIRVVFRTQDRITKEAQDLIKDLDTRSLESDGGSVLGVLISLAHSDMNYIEDKSIYDCNIDSSNSSLSKCIIDKWGDSDNDKFNSLINRDVSIDSEEKITRKCSTRSPGGLPISMKKRKFSPSKESIDCCLDTLEREVKVLSNTVSAQVHDEERKNRILQINDQLQQVLLKL